MGVPDVIISKKCNETLPKRGKTAAAALGSMPGV